VAEVPGALAEALRDRYPIERRLGSGGTATVYLARDLKHDRPVALKVLHSQLAATLGPERFEREIRFSARLQHPHILTVLDSGEAAGQLWFTMPYVRGESLRDRLRREGQLTVEEALRITHEALQALAYAHGEGIVHRDVKPENLLLAQDGSTLVADFGIARALGGRDESLTETGMAVGTPAYMSPEQSAGSAVDGRSDLYGMACVCYEMLAGEPPYTGPTAQAIIAKRLNDPLPSVRRLRPNVPPAVDQALLRALAFLPADRFATASDFARALQPTTPTPASTATVLTPPVVSGSAAGPARRLRGLLMASALGLVLLIGLGAQFAWRRSHAAVGPSGPRVLAVLPFENLGDSADGYFADGVTDEVRTKLSQVAGLEVIARGSSNQYRASPKPPQLIARELGVSYILTATVRWAKRPGGASRVRVTPELVEVRPGGVPRTKWEQPFDASLTDVFQVQADIAGKVASALDVALADSTTQRLAARPTRNLAAYDAFLRGDHLIVTEGKSDLTSARQAAAAYQEAIRLDSTFALAWAHLVRAEVLAYSNGETTAGRDTVARAARRAADRALSLAPDQPETYYAIGLQRAMLDLDGAGAIEALEHARTLAPNDVDLLSLLAGMLAFAGRADEAVALFSEAARLDPRSLLLARRYSGILLVQRRFREADSAAIAGLALAPDNFELVGYLVESRIARGDAVGARAALREVLRHVDQREFFRNVNSSLLWVDDSLESLALRLPPSALAEDRPEGLLNVAWVRWEAGRYAGARANADSARPLLEAQRVRQPADPRVPALLMFAYAWTGRRSDALAEAERWRALVRPQLNTLVWAIWIGQRMNIDLFSGDAAGAVALLDSLVIVPGGVTRAWLRIDPGFAPLRSDPRFQRLVAGE
jgi:eukaryotic-like serine/threonine-protein kinase